MGLGMVVVELNRNFANGIKYFFCLIRKYQAISSGLLQMENLFWLKEERKKK